MVPLWVETKRWPLHSAAFRKHRFGSPRQIFLFRRKNKSCPLSGIRRGHWTSPPRCGEANEPTEGSSRDQTGTILATASEHRPQAETLTSTGWPGNWRACLAVWRKQPRNECFPSLGFLWTCKISQLQRLSGCNRATKGGFSLRKKEWRTLHKGHVQSNWEVHEDTGNT